jgi:para-aminobenzoate N-oxygenase AurF
VKDLHETMEIANEAAESGASIFEAWDSIAGVRADEELRQRDRSEIHTKRFFPSEIVPHLQHHSVLSLSAEAKRFLEAQHLFQWLIFTTKFELRIVNRAVLEIAEDNTGFAVQRSQQRDAMRILVDEQYHAQYSLDVADQLQTLSGISAVPLEFDNYQSRLDSVAAEASIPASWVQFLQVAVFETLITSLLLTVPNDGSVITVVRNTVENHVADEVRHHAYFALLFKSFWQQLTPDEKTRVSRALPDIIIRSLAPNTSSASLALIEAGLDDVAVKRVIAESYGDQQTLASIRQAARKTMSMFSRAGVFDTPGARQAFIGAGLIVRGSI